MKTSIWLWAALLGIVAPASAATWRVERDGTVRTSPVTWRAIKARFR